MLFRANWEYFRSLPRGLASTGWCDQLCYLFFYLPGRPQCVLLLSADSREGAAWCSFQFSREMRYRIAGSLLLQHSLVPVLMHFSFMPHRSSIRMAAMAICGSDVNP